ncbi:MULTISPECIES: Lrp/AsnC family transcriptional regulator [Halobacterium]|uniref:Lrp/AsnC family transcriptional regulator n=1 Tax=Halobacterium TaxID=2239 RepID=UPI00073F6B5F|nr:MULTISPECIES: Lrp/AsnC ligand binding domain-containing protein [Halobacterium]MCG1004047.1 Lrp/AsnC ligand binding domain-containing protein [Halobacterium noricense]
MVTAYVLVKANTGEADRLLGAIASIDGVVDAHVVAGDVDVIAKLDVDEPGDVKAIAADEIQHIDGVEDTETYISM